MFTNFPKCAPRGTVGEYNSNMCKYIVIETKLTQSQVENDLHQNVELQNELQMMF